MDGSGSRLYKRTPALSTNGQDDDVRKTRHVDDPTGGNSYMTTTRTRTWSFMSPWRNEERGTTSMTGWIRERRLLTQTGS